MANPTRKTSQKKRTAPTPKKSRPSAPASTQTASPRHGTAESETARDSYAPSHRRPYAIGQRHLTRATRARDQGRWQGRRSRCAYLTTPAGKALNTLRTATTPPTATANAKPATAKPVNGHVKNGARRNPVSDQGVAPVELNRTVRTAVQTWPDARPVPQPNAVAPPE
jgi:hypothetical protein